MDKSREPTFGMPQYQVRDFSKEKLGNKRKGKEVIQQDDRDVISYDFVYDQTRGGNSVGIRGGRGSRGGCSRRGAHVPRVAAALDHHAVVQGNIKSKSISRATVLHKMDYVSRPGPLDLNRPSPDHHKDPTFPYPASSNDKEEGLGDGSNDKMEEEAGEESDSKGDEGLNGEGMEVLEANA